MPSSQSKWLLGVAVGLLLLGLLMAYNHQLSKAETVGGTVAKTQCAADTNAALLKAAQESLETVQQQLADATQDVTKLRAQKIETEQRNQQLQGEIKYVTSTWIPPGKAQPEPVPACVFTHGFVRVYNQSITSAHSGAPSVPAAVFAAGIDGAAAANTIVDPNRDLHPSNVVQSDILQHVTRYGQHCQHTEAQLNKLIDYLQKQGQRNASAG